MIWNKELIQIPTLCPIQFTEPREYTFFPEQGEYVPVIRTEGSLIQILIDQTIYVNTETIRLICYDINGNILNTQFFARYQLLSGVFVAELIFSNLVNANTFCYFEIKQGNLLLADSLYYKLLPSYTKDLKVIKAKHSSNDFSVQFKPEINLLYMPLTIEGNAMFETVEVFIDEDKISVRFNGIAEIYIPDTFTMWFLDEDNNTLHIKDIYKAGTGTIYTFEFNTSDLSGHKVHLVCMTGDNTVIFSNTNEYTFDTKIHADSTLIYDIECGFKPMDVRTEQQAEDYLEQNMTNEMVYGDIYEVKPLTIGDTKGIPTWRYVQMHRIFMCDNVTIDGEIHDRIEGAKMEKVEDTENGLAVYKIDLQTDINYLQ